MCLRWLRREIDIPELFTKRTGEILDLVKSAGPLDVLCLQEFSTDDRIVSMFHDALGTRYEFPVDYCEIRCMKIHLRSEHSYS